MEKISKKELAEKMKQYDLLQKARRALPGLLSREWSELENFVRDFKSGRIDVEKPGYLCEGGRYCDHGHESTYWVDEE